MICLVSSSFYFKVFIIIDLSFTFFTSFCILSSLPRNYLSFPIPEVVSVPIWPTGDNCEYTILTNKGKGQTTFYYSAQVQCVCINTISFKRRSTSNFVFSLFYPSPWANGRCGGLIERIRY